MLSADRSPPIATRSRGVPGVVVTVVLAVSLLTPTLTSVRATDVEGFVSTDTTWTLAGSPYVLTGDLTILDGATLRIDAGVVVYVQSRVPLLGLYVNGGLLINGTLTAPVSIQPSSPVPTPGEWRGIQVNLTGWIDSRNARISFAETGIHFQGACGFPGPANRPQLFLRETWISNNSYAGVRLEGSRPAVIGN